MKELVIIILGFVSLSCQNSKSGLTNEEFEAKIEAVEKSNMADKKLADGWYETKSVENAFRRIYKKTASQYFHQSKTHNSTG